MKRTLQLLAAILLTVILSGCSLLTTPEPKSGEILFADAFADPKTGWDTWNDEYGSMVVYQNDGLRILVNSPQFDYWSRPGLNYQDVHIEVDVAPFSPAIRSDRGKLQQIFLNIVNNAFAAVEDALEAHSERAAEYLLAHPMVADDLEEGLIQLGYSCEE